MKPWRALVAAALFALAGTDAGAAVSASLDRDHVSPGESVQLTLQRDGSGDSQPDLAPLSRDFQVMGRSSATSVQWVNGRLSSQRRLQLMLVPRRGGPLTVPPLVWDGESSAPLVLEVDATGGGAGASDANAAGNAEHVFLTSSIDQPRPYVQAAVTLTVRLHADQPLYRASLELAPAPDVPMQQLGKDVQRSEVRDGRDYQVVERRYVLFPQRSGPISLPGPVLNAQIGDASDPIFGRAFGNLRIPGLVGATRPLRLNGDAIKLDVRPRPAGAGATPWLPAQQVTLQESWQPANAAVHVGEPLTRHLSLSAVGQAAAQLPDLGALMALPDGFKAYPDQARLADDERSGSVIGTRDQDIALIASAPGTLTLPALHLAWWDTARDTPREAVLPARTVTVLPALATPGVPPLVEPALPAATAPAVPRASLLPASDPWPWISLGLGLLWLATLIAWWRGRHGSGTGRAARREPAAGASAPVPEAGARDARAAFEEACRANAPDQARRTLLAWARAEWGGDAPVGVQALAARIDDPLVTPLLRELDRACYAAAAWDGRALARALRVLPARPPCGAAIEPLGSLYV